jgi:drug/metabolite transporter (DMT)-like permease
MRGAFDRDRTFCAIAPTVWRSGRLDRCVDRASCGLEPIAMPRETPNLTPILLLGSSLLFALASVAVKLASPSVTNEMIVFFRSFFGLIAVTPWLLRDGWTGLRTRYSHQHVTRALAGLAAMYCFFYAISHLPLGEAMLLNYSSPLFIPFIARVWLGEPLPKGFGWAVGTGLVGITLILKPGSGFFSPAALIGLLSSVLTATAMVSIRGLTRYEPTLRIVFYFGVVCSVASAPGLVWGWRPLSLHALALLAAVGFLATCGQILLTRAYSLAPAARVGPFTYSTVLFAAFFGWLVWGEVPDRLSIAGAALVCTAGVLAIRALEPRAEEAPEEAIPEAAM